MRKDPHELAEINISDALITADNVQVLVIGISTVRAPVCRTGKSNGIPSERIDKHELGVHPINIGTDWTVFFAPAVNPIHVNSVSEGHANVFVASDPFDVCNRRCPRVGIATVHIFVEQGEAKNLVCMIIDRPEILNDAKGKRHEKRFTRTGQCDPPTEYSLSAMWGEHWGYRNGLVGRRNGIMRFGPRLKLIGIGIAVERLPVLQILGCDSRIVNRQSYV